MIQLSRPAQFDAAEQIIRGAGLDAHHLHVERNVLVDDGRPSFERFTPEAAASGVQQAAEGSGSRFAQPPRTA